MALTVDWNYGFGGQGLPPGPRRQPSGSPLDRKPPLARVLQGLIDDIAAISGAMAATTVAMPANVGAVYGAAEQNAINTLIAAVAEIQTNLNAVVALTPSVSKGTV